MNIHPQLLALADQHVRADGSKIIGTFSAGHDLDYLHRQLPSGKNALIIGESGTGSPGFECNGRFEKIGAARSLPALLVIFNGPLTNDHPETKSEITQPFTTAEQAITALAALEKNT